MKLYLVVAFLLTIAWALGMLGSGLSLLYFCASDFNPVYLPFLAGSLIVWFGAAALSKAMARRSFNYGTVHGSAA